MKITGFTTERRMALASVMLLASHSTYRSGCDAFAPIHHSNSARLPVQSQVMTDSASATALHANLFDRFTRVAKANLNNILQGFEDPEKVMTQALDDMQTDLVRVRQTYAEVTATQRRMDNSKRQLESQADDWYRRAQLALKKSNEDLAREALARREALMSQAQSIEKQINAQATNIDTLYEGMQALQQKILEASGKKSQMSARAKTAKTTQKINDMMSGLTGKTSMDAFNKMEEKVLALEAAAEVSNDMAKTMMSKALAPSSKKGATSDIELQFRALESSDSIDKELNKLKANMLPPATKKIEIKDAAVKTPAKSWDYLSY